MPLDHSVLAEAEGELFNDSADLPSTTDEYQFADRGAHERNILIQRGTPVLNQEMTLI